jgi:2-methylcitrate dehydratase PrpD
VNRPSETKPAIATLWGEFAASATLAKFPDLARARAVDAITDVIGCIRAGSPEPACRKLLRVLPNTATPGEAASALLIGTSRWASPVDAALYNGTAAHALDYDDITHPAYSHPSAVLVPALLSVAPLGRPSGAEFIAAYIVGIEVFGKLGRTLNTAHYIRGWHATATLGTLAAALAAGRLLNLDAARLALAMNIAASSASGVRANFGSMVKPLHAGLAARNGVLAALLAREEFSAAPGALDQPYGYFALFEGADGHKPGFMSTPGEPLEITTDHGLALKPHPSCGATHTGIEAALILRDRIKIEAIQSIRAGITELGLKPLIHHPPTTPLEAKFSLPFCLAAALSEGRVDLRTFTEQALLSSAINRLSSLVKLEVDERVAHGTEFPTVLTIETADGARHEHLEMEAIGKPSRWFSTQQLREKFTDCIGVVPGFDRTDALFDQVQQLARSNAVSSLVQELRAL